MNPKHAELFYDAVISTSYITDSNIRDELAVRLCQVMDKVLKPVTIVENHPQVEQAGEQVEAEIRQVQRRRLGQP